MPLATELEYFEEIKDQLLKQHEGRYALIVGRNLVGVYDHARDAYEQGVRTYGNIPMLIREIQPFERPVHVPALQLGLLGARP